jgi:hypothetical protein
MQCSPETLEREKVKARLNKTELAQGVAQLIKRVLASVNAVEKDYWVRLELDIHVENGKATEKLAKLNLYADMIDQYGTNVLNVPGQYDVPTEFFRGFEREN